MTQYKDIAGDVLRRTQQEMIADATPNTKLGTDLFTKLKPDWQPEDKNALIQIRAASNANIAAIFSGAMETLDTFYNTVRVPQLSSSGKPLTDDKGRVVWEKDEHGRTKTDWSKLEGYDLETALLDLSEVKIFAGQQVHQLYQEAIFAKYAYEDAHFEAYESVVEGTVGDRNAAANRKTQDFKYNAWMRYYLWDLSKAFMDEVEGIVKLLTNMRFWHIKEQ